MSKVYVIANSRVAFDQYLADNAIRQSDARYIRHPDQLRGLDSVDVRVASWPDEGTRQQWQDSLNIIDRGRP